MNEFAETEKNLRLSSAWDLDHVFGVMGTCTLPN